MGLKVIQCKQCGRLFQSFGKAICADCLEERDNNFLLVRDFIYLHPNATIIEISKETGVEEPLILEFLKEDMLVLNTSEQLLSCEKCGKPINSGRFCKQCREFFENVFTSQAVETKHASLEDERRLQRQEQKKGIRGDNAKEKMHTNFWSK